MDESDESNMRVSLTQVWRYNTGQCVDASPVIVDCSRHTVLDDSQDLSDATVVDESPPSTDTHDSRAPSVVYIGSHSHEFSCINLLSGVCIWSVQLEDRIESSASVSKCGKWVVVGKGETRRSHQTK